jgi:hypothetical protein
MAKKKRVDEVISFKLRMPEGLRQKIEAEAEKANRSMNSEILWRLGQTFGQEWQEFLSRVEAKEKTKQEQIQALTKSLIETPEVQEIIAELIAKSEGR